SGCRRSYARRSRCRRGRSSRRSVFPRRSVERPRHDHTSPLQFITMATAKFPGRIIMSETSDLSMTRRSMLASATAGAGAAALGGTPALAQARKTFVLVHGAWHGGWCWRRVADLLEKKGHKVYTPTLTGVGDRSHLISKDI